MQSQEKTDLNKIIEFLAEKFPASFSVKGEAKPLKIGIFNDIAAQLTEQESVSKTQVRHALRRYTNSWRYLEAVIKGGQRVDLEGNDVEALTSDHIQHAEQQLTESKAKFQEKKKAARVQDKPASKKPANKLGNPAKRKPRSVNKGTNPKPKVQKELVANEDFSQGTKVLVKFGSAPVSATILETSKDEVSVQLVSGMTIKVSKGSIFQA